MLKTIYSCRQTEIEGDEELETAERNALDPICSYIDDDEASSKKEGKNNANSKQKIVV